MVFWDVGPPPSSAKKGIMHISFILSLIISSLCVAHRALAGVRPIPTKLFFYYTYSSSLKKGLMAIGELTHEIRTFFCVVTRLQ